MLVGYWWNSAPPCWLSFVATHPRLTAEHPPARHCFSASAEVCHSTLAYLPRRNNPLDSGPESSVATHPCQWIQCSWWRSSLMPHVHCAVCADAPSCWKMKPSVRRVLQSATSFGIKVSSFTLAFSGMKYNRPLPLKQTAAETIHVAQTWLFEPEGDSHPPHASSRLPKHGCSDCLQEGWDKSFLVSENHLSSSLWHTLKKFSTAFKIMSEMTCAGTLRNAVRWRSYFAIRWTEWRWMFSSAAIFRVLLLSRLLVNKSVHRPLLCFQQPHLLRKFEKKWTSNLERQ